MPAHRPEDMVPTFEAAFNSGDIEQLMALYEPDCVLVPQPSHWDLSGTGPDGAAVSLSGDTSEVIRKQSDGPWRYVIDDAFGLP